MQVSRQGRRIGGWAMLLAVLLLCSGMAQAQRTEGDRAAASGAYEAEVAVRNQTDGERNAALGRALAQVLAKVTGDRSVSGRPGVRAELSKARGFVAGYDYRQDEGVSATGAPTFQTTLVARFKRDAVDDLIQMLGLSTWPEPRPKPVLPRIAYDTNTTAPKNSHSGGVSSGIAQRRSAITYEICGCRACHPAGRR